MRLIDETGQVLGIFSSMQALAIARERDLDLVEVSPMAVPPVCKLMDYGRFKYEQAKKESEARKNQKTTELKEVRISPRTDDHDLAVKVRKVEEFLADGDKVKIGVRFRGREMAHPELGRQLLEKIINDLKNISAVERPPLMEGKMMFMILTRAPGWEPPKKEPTPAAHRGEKAQANGGATPQPTAPVEATSPSSTDASAETPPPAAPADAATPPTA